MNFLRGVEMNTSRFNIDPFIIDQQLCCTSNYVFNFIMFFVKMRPQFSTWHHSNKEQTYRIIFRDLDELGIFAGRQGVFFKNFIYMADDLPGCVCIACGYDNLKLTP